MNIQFPVALITKILANAAVISSVGIVQSIELLLEDGLGLFITICKLLVLKFHEDEQPLFSDNSVVSTSLSLHRTTRLNSILCAMDVSLGQRFFPHLFHIATVCFPYAFIILTDRRAISRDIIME